MINLTGRDMVSFNVFIDFVIFIFQFQYMLITN